MAHIIISAVILAATIVFAFAYQNYVKNWQDEHRADIKSHKRIYGAKSTLYPVRHFRTTRAMFVVFWAAFAYLAIAILIFFFA